MKPRTNAPTSDKPESKNTSHAWRGTWDRPLFVDENTRHPFTIARMTDHNVKGRDKSR
jgi:hypothetical protein